MGVKRLGIGSLASLLAAAEQERKTAKDLPADPNCLPPPGFVPEPGAQWDGVVRITPAQLQALPLDTVLHSIFGGPEVVVGRHRIGNDLRDGFLAWGFRSEDVDGSAE